VREYRLTERTKNFILNLTETARIWNFYDDTAMKDIQGYLDHCKKWLVEQIEQRTADAGDVGYGCRIYTTCFYENVFVFPEPLQLEWLLPNHAVGRLLITKTSFFGGVSYVPSAKKIMVSYDDLDIGTLEKILMNLGFDLMNGKLKPLIRR
jgi:hypothetical protein